MTMRVTIITTLMGESGSLLTAGNTYTVSKTFGAAIVGDKRATDIDNVLREGAVVSISTDTLITAADDARTFNCTTALTITIPANLSPRPSFIVNPPASGNVSIAVSGGANINGATTTLTRARTANVAGFVVVPYAESDGYGVNGS